MNTDTEKKIIELRVERLMARGLPKEIASIGASFNPVPWRENLEINYNVNKKGIMNEYDDPNNLWGI